MAENLTPLFAGELTYFLKDSDKRKLAIMSGSEFCAGGVLSLDLISNLPARPL
jgi:hypothetical protein